MDNVKYMVLEDGSISITLKEKPSSAKEVVDFISKKEMIQFTDETVDLVEGKIPEVGEDEDFEVTEIVIPMSNIVVIEEQEIPSSLDSDVIEAAIKDPLG